MTIMEIFDQISALEATFEFPDLGDLEAVKRNQARRDLIDIMQREVIDRLTHKDEVSDE